MNRDSMIMEILDNMRVPSHLSGYSYLVTAIGLCIDGQLSRRRLSFTKDVYVETARLHGSTPARVERCIRSAIEAAFDLGAVEDVFPVLGARVCQNSGKIVNSEFIMSAARKIACRIKEGEDPDGTG